jgi:hypothetical protein
VSTKVNRFSQESLFLHPLLPLQVTTTIGIRMAAELGTGIAGLVFLFSSIDGALKSPLLIESIAQKGDGSELMILRFDNARASLIAWRGSMKVDDPQKCRLKGLGIEAANRISMNLAAIEKLYQGSQKYLTRYNANTQPGKFVKDTANSLWNQKSQLRWTIKDKENFMGIITNLEAFVKTIMDETRPFFGDILADSRQPSS